MLTCSRQNKVARYNSSLQKIQAMFPQKSFEEIVILALDHTEQTPQTRPPAAPTGEPGVGEPADEIVQAPVQKNGSGLVKNSNSGIVKKPNSGLVDESDSELLDTPRYDLRRISQPLLSASTDAFPDRSLRIRKNVDYTSIPQIGDDADMEYEPSETVWDASSLLLESSKNPQLRVAPAGELGADRPISDLLDVHPDRRPLITRPAFRDM